MIAYLHRSREEVDRLRRELREQGAQLDADRRQLQTEWIERQRKRISELEQKFGEAMKQHEAALERALASVKERELRAQIEKQTKRATVKARGEARDEADAAVVQHFPSRRPIWGQQPRPLKSRSKSASSRPECVCG